MALLVVLPNSTLSGGNKLDYRRTIECLGCLHAQSANIGRSVKMIENKQKLK